MTSVKTALKFNTFESKWELFSEEERAAVAKDAAVLEPEIAIMPVLAGITSYNFVVRNNARKSLKIIQDKITKLLSDPYDSKTYLKGMEASASICSRIYAQIYSEMPFNELVFFFKLLLVFKGKGAYFAFQAVYTELVSVASMQKIINTVSETSRLAFVDRYLQTSPGIRLKFGVPFKKILKSIKSRDVVVKFYSDLFDAKRDADPFLNNINPDLRDPDQIISNEIKSLSLEKKIMGLKALSMVSTKISPGLLIDILAAQEVKKVRIVIYNIIESSSMGLYPELFYPVLQLFYKCDIQ